MNDLDLHVAFGPVVVRIRADRELESIHRPLRRWLAAGATTSGTVPDLVFHLGPDAAPGGSGPGDALFAGRGTLEPDRLVLEDGRAWRVSLDRHQEAGVPPVWRLAPINGPLLRTVGRLPTPLFRFLHVHRFSQPELRASTFLYRHLIPAVQALLVRQQATFVHASSVRAPGGPGMLVSGWGGSGKTSGSAALYLGRPDSWQFMSDDLAIVSADGTLHFSPIPLNIFPYSTTRFPPLRDRVVRPMGPADRLQWAIRGRVMGRKGVARRLPPISDPPPGRAAPLETALHFQRSSGGQVQVRQVAPRDLARVCASILLYELGSSMPMYAAANAFCVADRPQLPTFTGMVEEAQRILERAFGNARTLVVDVPESHGVEQLGDLLESVWTPDPRA